MRLEARDARKRMETVTSASYLGTAHEVPGVLVCGMDGCQKTEGRTDGRFGYIQRWHTQRVTTHATHAPDALRRSQTAVAKVGRCGWNSSSYLVAYRFTFST